MDRGAVAVAVAVSLLLAGCLGGGSGLEDPAASGDDLSGGDGDRAGSGTDAPSADATGTDLQAAPTWQVGEWWTAEREDWTDGEMLNITVVVADRQGDTYLVGVAAEDFRDLIVLGGWPALGEIRAGSDLSWTVKNSDFLAVDFPLEEGKTWETPYWGVDGWTAEVESVDGSKATIGISGPNGNGTYTYDGAMRTTTRFAWEGNTDYRVTDHGTGYEGEVVVPHGKNQHETGRVVGAFELGDSPLPFGLEPASPRATVDVRQAEASLLLIAGSGTVNDVTPPGFYRETATSPGGETFQLQTTGPDGLEFVFAHASEAAGTWQFDHVAGGFGIAGTELVAYEQLDVTLGGNTTERS